MPKKTLGRGQSRDTYYALRWLSHASVDPAIWPPSWLPTNGFRWVPGLRVQATGQEKGIFLTPAKWEETDRWTPVFIPEDLYLRFANLRPREKDILEFANKYGSLTLWGCQSHFHVTNAAQKTVRDMAVWSEGEEFDEWKHEIETFGTALNLWYSTTAGDKFSISKLSKLIKQSWRNDAAGMLVWPGDMIDPKNEIQFARESVIATINANLNTHTFHPRCLICGTQAQEISGNDSVWTELRSAGEVNESAALTLVPANLKKALWLQFASYISGQRKLAKCLAEDCPSPLMDVTASLRPGARKMHPTCEERIRKRKYRNRKKQRDNRQRENIR